MKRIFLIRHCKAVGQDPEALLTGEGIEQASILAEFLKNMDVDYIISSPYKRAIDTILPLSDLIEREVHTDVRLIERVLSTTNLKDWMERLEETYLDLDLKFEGGESSIEATTRGMQVIQEALNRPENTILIVTHGAILSLMIKCFNNEFGFQDWQKLSNPDVYKLEIQNEGTFIERIWK